MADLGTMRFSNAEIFWVVFCGVFLFVLAVTIVLVLIALCIVVRCSARARDRAAREIDMLAAGHGHALHATQACNPCIPFSGDAALFAADEPSGGAVGGETGVRASEAASADADGERNPAWGVEPVEATRSGDAHCVGASNLAEGDVIHSVAYDGDVITIGLREDASERAIAMTMTPMTEEGAAERAEQGAIGSTAAVPADAEAPRAAPSATVAPPHATQRTGAVHVIV